MLAAFYEPFFDESADSLFKMTKDYPGGTPQ
jgi:acyl-CoA-binding protein